MLLTGEEYTGLPNTYVIFICDFDPFGKEKYRYTFRTTCQESENVDLEDGRTGHISVVHERRSGRK